MNAIDEQQPRASWYRRWDIVVLVICAVGLAGFLFPAVHAARQAQRRMQESNNLKQLGLAMDNYHSAFERFPRGAELDTSGVARHGWLLQIHPFLEASAWPFYVDRSLAWDHPCNSYLFMEQRSQVLRPGVGDTYTRDGFGLTHTMANPNILNCGPGVRMSELTSGLSHSWLFGGVVGEYQPWGYPYNWRKLTWPLNADGGGYGGWRGGAQFCLADGSVRFVASELDREVLAQLASAPPIAAAELTAVPLRRFDVTDDRVARKREWFEAVPRQPTKGSIGTDIIYGMDGEPRVATLRFTPSEMSKIGLGLKGVVERYPSLQVLLVGEINEEDAARIAKLRQLRTLIVYQLKPTAAVLQSLQSLPKLKHVSVADPDCVVPLVEALPDCEIHLRVRPGF